MSVLNQRWFVNLALARWIVETWRLEYNRDRPHNALGHLTPSEFAIQVRATTPETQFETAGSKL
jgi:putative transposase